MAGDASVRRRSPGADGARRRRSRLRSAVCHDAVSPAAIASTPAARGPITGTISTIPAETADQQPVGQAVQPERERERRGDEGDHQQLAAHERAELGVDQVPGVPHDDPLLPAQQPEDESLGALLLEHPVGGHGKGEEDADQHLERGAAVGDCRMDQAGAAWKPLQPVLDADEDLSLEPVGLARRRRRRRRRRSTSGASPGLPRNLVEARATDDQRSEQQQPDGDDEADSAGRDRPALGTRWRCSASASPAASRPRSPGRGAEAPPASSSATARARRRSRQPRPSSRRRIRGSRSSGRRNKRPGGPGGHGRAGAPREPRIANPAGRGEHTFPSDSAR